MEDWSETDIAGIDFLSSGTEDDGSEEVIREISYVWVFLGLGPLKIGKSEVPVEEIVVDGVFP